MIQGITIDLVLDDVVFWKCFKLLFRNRWIGRTFVSTIVYGLFLNKYKRCNYILLRRYYDQLECRSNFVSLKIRHSKFIQKYFSRSCYTHNNTQRILIDLPCYLLNETGHDIWRMSSSEMRRRGAVVRTDISENHVASIIRVERIRELRTTLAIYSKWSTLRISSQRADGGGDTFIRIFGSYKSHTASHPRRRHSS
jgi:hypothetical protein